MSAHKGRSKPHIEEEHENHERWLVSYADMVTLLFCLFVVMFAIGAVDQEKFEEFSNGLTAGFGAPLSVVSSADGILDQPGVMPVPVDLKPVLDPRSPASPEAPAREAEPQPGVRAEAEAEAENLRALKEDLDAALAAAGLQDSVRYKLNERGLIVSIITDKVLFPADRADLSDRGRQVLDTMAPVLAAIPNHLAIEGHTNQAPARPKFYASEWELSSARAVTVLRRLSDANGLAAGRLSATGYGQTRPLWPVDDAFGREVNKRVEVVILSLASAEARGELAEIAPDVTDPLTPAHPATPAH